jgi:CRISPR-associated protein Csb2
MTRFAVRGAAEAAGWDAERVRAFVLGHGEARGGTHVAVGGPRFAYMPLPSLEAHGEGRVAGPVRRVLILAPDARFEPDVAWARQAVSGRDLVDEATGEVHAMLSCIPASDRGVRAYLGPASVWASVTPVVLPGFDDPDHLRRKLRGVASGAEQRRLLERLAERTEGLLRKAISQAGLPGVLADHAEIAWRKVSFWPGAEHADRYGVPDHLKRYPRVHVRVRWRSPDLRSIELRGPFCLGGGRFYGLGLLAPLEERDRGAE